MRDRSSQLAACLLIAAAMAVPIVPGAVSVAGCSVNVGYGGTSAGSFNGFHKSFGTSATTTMPPKTKDDCPTAISNDEDTIGFGGMLFYSRAGGQTITDTAFGVTYADQGDG